MANTPIMVMGCTSDAGKSFLVTGLCRYFANRNVRVAPFKAQNMSNNAAVTSEGLEMGRAQYVQALAARAIPQARMNPVLLKPTADTASQVVVMGKVDHRISAQPWLERKARLWPIVRDALQSLLADYDQIVIEGAGSPAEVNLRGGDIVNMSVALECGADVFLVADIDRGGAFAHLLGTWTCLAPDERALIKGFVLNKFRGDQALLGNAMEWLQQRTGVPTVAVIPMIRHALPQEDAFPHRAELVNGRINIALIVYPYASNLDEFDPLIYERGVSVVPIRESTPLAQFDAIILPGSKHTAESLRFLRDTGLAAELTRAADRGIRILGVCGGMQLLGRHLFDPYRVESGDLDGLGLLDVTTTFNLEKTTRQRQVITDRSLLHGYEIHHGQTHPGPQARVYLDDGLGWEQGNVCGIYLHGLFENTDYRQEFLARFGWQGCAEDWHARIESEFDRVAGLMDDSMWLSEYLSR